MSIDLALAIEAEGWSTISDVEALIQQALDEAARSCGIHLSCCPEVSVLLCDDVAIRALNAAWRGMDEATNVLSFPVAKPLALDSRPMLGDIAIAWQTTASEAHAEGKDVADHTAHLVIHGFLHLVGFDHESESDADAMEKLEVKVLFNLGIADPYANATLERRLP